MTSSRLGLFALVLVVLAIAGPCAGVKNSLNMLRNRNHELKALDDPSELWFTQKTDHYNHQDQRTWQQRYFVNQTTWDKASFGPIFLQIGGEGPISSAYVQEFAMSTYAKMHGALQLALEHRFYGKSNPFSTLSTSNYALLSSQQALADIANFLDQIIPKFYPPTVRPTVVVFGCSYPGNLAGWFRLKYPNSAVGGVSNSSPVRAVLDFFQYLDVVDQSLSYFMGPTCDQRIQEATEVLQQQLSTPSGQLQVQQEFRTCTVPNTTKDIQTFMSTVIGNWQGTVQYNAEHHNPVTIDTLCDVMENMSLTPIQAYAQVSNSFLTGKCMVVNYEAVVLEMKDAIPPNAARSWYYQTCTEFGYYQTTDSPSTVQPFGDLLPLSYYTDMCTDIFGFPFVDPTQATNTYYGADEPIGSNVLFVSGSVDPWHSLTVTQNLTESVRAFLIEGSAHCAQLFPSSDEVNPPPGILQAQEYTNSQITRWLSVGNPSC